MDRRLLGETRLARLAFAVTVSLSLLGGLLIIGQASLLSRAISNLFLEGSTRDQIGDLFILLIAVIGLRALNQVGIHVAATNVAIGVKQDLRRRLVEHLFNTTIRENIRIGDKNACDAEIEAAARIVQVHEFIMTLPDGYDTDVGEGSALLSGGERQRLALARMLLKDAPIWLLDEITTNLDPVTAVRVMDAVMAAGGDHTIVLMTHRTELIRGYRFDRVIELTVENELR